MRRIILLATVALVMTAMLVVLAGTAAAHLHVVNNPADKPDHEQQIAHGQNHPGYSYDAATNLSTSCEDPAAPSDPAFYGLESAHHGPDAGDPGKDEGCYAAFDDDAGRTLPPPDTNPAID